MFSNAFEIFLNSLAYSFWPFAFFWAALYIFNRYFNDAYKKKVKKEKGIRSIDPEAHDLAEKALNFKTPKIETSFGDQRIGEVHGHEEKN
jgi:hypothetical protein|tara:strand:+ start:350 stop:619 length:270 start_codon:yes stop_codon:yes gene_type:complete